MAKCSYFFARGKWDDRGELEYTPAGTPDNEGVVVDAFGFYKGGSNYNSGVVPALCYIEENGSNIFLKYAGNDTIIKIVKE